VLGEAYVNKALAEADDFTEPLQDLVTEYCWGAVWGRDDLSRKTRSMLNLAMIRCSTDRTNCGCTSKPH
jgi:4-carboxymuconolactone decarboxylase